MTKGHARPPFLSPTFWIVISFALRTNALKTLAALGTMIRGKKQRGWNRLSQLASRTANSYRFWTLSAEPRILEHYIAEQTSPLERVLCVVVDADQTASRLIDRTRESLHRAFGDNVAITPFPLPHAREPLLKTLIPHDTEWVLSLHAGDQVSPELGRILAGVIAANTEELFFYWDEDFLGQMGRAHPWIKPDWDPLLHQARNMLFGACLFSVKLLKEGQIADPVNSINHIIENMGINPVHIPLILSHKRTPPAFHPIETSFDRQMSWPSVSILVPTRDKPMLLKNCLDGLNKIQYSGLIDIVIIDNNTKDKDALEIMNNCKNDSRVTILRDNREFNFSSLNNLGARATQGDFICLYNNDVEPLDGDWLSHMMSHAIKNDVGAVGAMLLYPDMTLQHGGVAIGVGGAAGHIMRGAAQTDSQNACWFKATREVSAVTAACLLVSRAKYWAVGGLDEENFAVAFNDVDFSLKLKQAGWRNIYCAEARLIHHESKSRGSDMAPESIGRYMRELHNLQTRWQTVGAVDPHYSPLFQKDTEQCVLAI